jgi:prepilin-type N-terminal cleavage/methylation domain-containing protein
LSALTNHSVRSLRGGVRRGVGRAFTLVEILIVVIILGILAALVVPKFTSASTDSKASAAAVTARSVQQKILEYRSTHGVYPDAIDPEWFANKALPKSPFAPLHDDPIEIVSEVAAHRHPQFKFTNDATKPFWYNTTNGAFRARVATQSSTANTLALYNKANGSAVSSYFGRND